MLDLGAGYGALTAPLARAGARVIAIELDPALAQRLRRRFSAEPLVKVVEADLRRMPFPNRPFWVVANPPFALTTLLCRRLLGDRGSALSGADLILEWGAARWLSATVPRDRETAAWTARYQVELVRRIPADRFSPPPRSDAAHLRIRRRTRPAGPVGRPGQPAQSADPASRPSRPSRLDPDRRQGRPERVPPCLR